MSTPDPEVRLLTEQTQRLLAEAELANVRLQVHIDQLSNLIKTLARAEAKGGL